jgi:23S rRNA (adenine2503-C2)-methyltransferase
MNNLQNFTLDKLQHQLKPSFRAKQVYDWLYKKYVSSYEEMKNIPQDLKQTLIKNYPLELLEILQIQISNDGTKKYLFRLNDNHTIEAVLLLMKQKQKDENGNIVKSEKYTFCISTQVGCKVGCSFCLTAKGGFVRDLTTSEIVEQVRLLKKDNNIPQNKAVNIVYMGMGEPLDNFDNLVNAIKIISQLEGLAISTKRQTISTSGISSKIEKLGQLNLGVQLAISLHAVDDNLRSELIPMNKAYNINSIIQAVKNYPIDTRKRVMFEYLVIKDKNDDIASAKKLIKLLSGIRAKVNLIYFNPYDGSSYQRPSNNSMHKFQKYLLDHGLFCSIRESKGIDISAACGQLKEQNDNT